MVKVYVEGGGDTNALRAECRKGFTAFLTNAGLAGRLPRIVACGSRADAYDSFCTAVAQGEEALLLVDSETPVAETILQTNQPWQHLKNRQGDGWEKPADSTDEQCHLMVQCMEAWLLCDPATVKEYFGQGFDDKHMPNVAAGIEQVAKAQLYNRLKSATAKCKSKGAYNKGSHSFKLLAQIDPQKVMHASPWAKRFIGAF